jgi:hypothetical protein
MFHLLPVCSQLSSQLQQYVGGNGPDISSSLTVCLLCSFLPCLRTAIIMTAWMVSVRLTFVFGLLLVVVVVVGKRLFLSSQIHKEVVEDVSDLVTVDLGSTKG